MREVGREIMGIDRFVLCFITGDCRFRLLRDRQSNPDRYDKKDFTVIRKYSLIGYYK
jgi:hypothetical protein